MNKRVKALILWKEIELHSKILLVKITLTIKTLK